MDLYRTKVLVVRNGSGDSRCNIILFFYTAVCARAFINVCIFYNCTYKLRYIILRIIIILVHNTQQYSANNKVVEPDRCARVLRRSLDSAAAAAAVLCTARRVHIRITTCLCQRLKSVFLSLCLSVWYKKRSCALECV